ncbi:DUF4097 family beta strand repeat-containing protein [Thalassiella azotivora]
MAERWTVSGPRVIEVGGPQAPPREVRVRLVGGRADVVAHDELDVVRVEVASVRGRDLVVTRSDGVLEVAHPTLRWEGLLDALRSSFGRDDAAEVSIAVPRGVEVRLGTVAADGLVAGTTAPARVRTVSGTVVVDGVHGLVEARTVSGAVEVRDQHGPLVGDTVSGSLTVQAASLPHLRAKSVSGSLTVDLASAPATLAATTVSGDVTVRIPADAGFAVDVTSVSGHVVAGGRRLADRPGTNGGHLTHGDGAVSLHAKTVSGDVTLLQADGARPDGVPA